MVDWGGVAGGYLGWAEAVVRWSEDWLGRLGVGWVRRMVIV
jgi:hypothetical protein